MEEDETKGGEGRGKEEGKGEEVRGGGRGRGEGGHISYHVGLTSQFSNPITQNHAMPYHFLLENALYHTQLYFRES